MKYKNLMDILDDDPLRKRIIKEVKSGVSTMVVIDRLVAEGVLAKRHAYHWYTLARLFEPFKK